MIKHKRLMLILSLLALLGMACGFTGLIGGEDLPGDEEVREEDSVQQESMTEAPTAAPETEGPPSGPGETFENPAPVGMEVLADNKAFVVLSATRPADELVAEANRFNEEAGPGEEYLFVEIQITCEKPAGEICEFTPFNMLVYGSLEESHTRTFVAGIDHEIDSVDFNGGETVTGVIPFLVGQEETDLLLIYQPFSGGAYFFTVPE